MRRGIKILLICALAVFSCSSVIGLTLVVYPEIIIAGFQAMNSCNERLDWVYPEDQFTQSRAIELSVECLQRCGKDMDRLTLYSSDNTEAVSFAIVDEGHMWADTLWKDSDSTRVWDVKVGLIKDDNGVSCQAVEGL